MEEGEYLSVIIVYLIMIMIFEQKAVSLQGNIKPPK